MDNISQAPPGLVLSPWSETQANQTPRAVPTENTINENSESLLESKQAEMAEGNIQPSIPTVCWENMSLSEKLLKKLEIIGAQLWAFSQPLIKRGVIEAAPALLLVAFSCGFSVAFLAVDDGPCGCGNGSNCTGGLWVSLYFTNTLHTSIGYGTVVPCTTAGRGLTMVYIIVAIPLMLLTLTRFGNWLLSLVHQIGFGWLFIRGKEDGTSRSNFNLLCGITLAASWILLSAAIFYGCECYQDSVDKLAPASYFTSLYFVMISLMTVGLGDIDFKDKKFTIFYFTIIFIGYSMVSMVIQLFEEKLEEFMAELINRIQEDYRENLARARETEEDLDEDKIEKEKDDPKATVKNLFNSSLQNKVVSLFLKDKQLITLLEKVEASSNMVSKSTQTEKPKPPSNPRWNI